MARIWLQKGKFLQLWEQPIPFLHQCILDSLQHQQVQHQSLRRVWPSVIIHNDGMLAIRTSSVAVTWALVTCDMWSANILRKWRKEPIADHILNRDTEQQQKRGKRLKGNKAPFENCKTVTKNTAKMAVIVTREFSFVIGHKVEQYLQVCRVCEGSTSCNFSSHWHIIRLLGTP